MCKTSTSLLLVSDAMAGLRMPPGRYELGNQTVLLDAAGDEAVTITAGQAVYLHPDHLGRCSGESVCNS